MTDVNGVLLGPPPGGTPDSAVPFTVDDTGVIETVEQGTSAEIVQCVANLVGTRPGTRFMVPTYGIVDPTFGGLDRVALQTAVAKWEPRATVSVQVTPANEEVIVVGVVGGTS